MFTDDKITEIFVMCDEFSQKFDEFFKIKGTVLLVCGRRGCFKYLASGNQKNRPFGYFKNLTSGNQKSLPAGSGR